MSPAKYFLFSVAASVGLVSLPGQAAGRTYELKVTNGGAMSISSSVVYVLDGQEPLIALGSAASKGFIALCEKGNASARLEELRRHPRVRSAIQTTKSLQPGESVRLEVQVDDPATQSLHFETMYGKTKEICGVYHSSSNDLKLDRGQVLVASDRVVESGAFQAPALLADDATACDTAMSATACLRILSKPVSQEPRVRAFVGYLPAVLESLTKRYGAQSAQELLVPTGGQLQFQLKANKE